MISHKFFKKAAAEIGIKLGSERDYAVGMFFFPQNELARNQAKKMFEIIAEKEGLTVLGWRNVPSKPEVLGHRAVDCMPAIMQCFIKRPHGVKRGLPFDRKLYVARRVFEQSNEDTYVVSLSSRTIVYKGMFLVGDLRNFFWLIVPLLSHGSGIVIITARGSSIPLITSLQSLWFTPVFQPTQIQAGRELILTE